MIQVTDWKCLILGVDSDFEIILINWKFRFLQEFSKNFPNDLKENPWGILAKPVAGNFDKKCRIHTGKLWQRNSWRNFWKYVLKNFPGNDTAGEILEKSLKDSLCNSWNAKN